MPYGLQRTFSYSLSFNWVFSVIYDKIINYFLFNKKANVIQNTERFYVVKVTTKNFNIGMTFFVLTICIVFRGFRA